jgi:pyruvate kinase
MLISSLPPVHQEELLRSIIQHPAIEAVRYNTGMSSPYDPYDVIGRILELTKPQGKPLYVDLKGKQLRVAQWATPPYGPIVLNHKISVELPAKVYFRGDDCCELKEVVNGNEIYVDPTPKYPVGKGQSVNIIGKNLKIEGGLLDLDHRYIKAAVDQGVQNFMLSFVEGAADVQELEEAIVRHSRGTIMPDMCQIVFKIESVDGVEFVRSLKERHFSGKSPYRLMAARDDLMIEIGIHAMMDALRLIVQKDSQAICASRLLMGLEQGKVSMADLSDIEYMRSLGFRHFMLSDEISREHASEAAAFWEKYVESRPFVA